LIISIPFVYTFASLKAFKARINFLLILRVVYSNVCCSIFNLIIEVLTDTGADAYKVTITVCRVNARNCREDFTSLMNPLDRVASALTRVREAFVPVRRHQTLESVRSILQQVVFLVSNAFLYLLDFL